MSIAVYPLIKNYVDERIAEVKSRLYNPIYGVYWNKGTSPTLTRTHDAVGLSAAVGLGGAWAVNSFDKAEIFGEMGPVTDTLGNVFIRIPKFYIKKTDGTAFKTWAVSKYQYPGFYLPWCFWDFANGVELPYVDIGKYKATSDGSNRLESKPNLYPLINQTLPTFRTRAQNNNAGGLAGYQLLDIHAVDILRTLMFIEFGTLDLQTVMYGYATGQYNAAHVLTAGTNPAGNTLVVSNATGALYHVGQAISVGTSLGGNQGFYGRTITNIQIDTPGAGSTTITFDGDAVVLATNNILYNTGWKNGFSAAIVASSGSIGSNSDGKYPCMYRGIESPYADLWQWVDGVNINNWQAWVAKNPADYASNVFAHPYEQLSYVNHNANNYVQAMGWDAPRPMAEFPVAVQASSTQYYCDYYYQDAGQRVAPFGGSWNAGAYAGPSSWGLYFSSSYASVGFGARLLKKAL